MSEVRLYLFGTPGIEYQGTPVKIERRKALALAAYLALNDQPQSRDSVAGLLWPDLDQEHARSALRSALRGLTTPIPVDWIQASRTTLALKRDVTWVDVSDFSDRLAQCGSHGHALDTLCDECVSLYQQALALYPADFLSGFHLPDSAEYDHWQLNQQEWLRRELAGVMRGLAHYEAEAKRFESAIAYARRWLALDELHEPAYRLLMRLFAASGQRSEALRQYRQCVDVLNRELASPPEDETSQLYEAIQDNQLSVARGVGTAPAPSAAILPPLPLLIVGREDVLHTLRRRLGIGGEMRPLTIIQGWPGVGKSTIVALLAHDAEIARQYPDGILWASLGETPDIPGQLNAWASALGLGEGRDRGVEETSAQITATLREKRVLLIVDDVWQPEHIQPFRVGGQSCALVLTSRLNDVASALAPTSEDIYRLPVLSETAGQQLLHRLTPETVTQHSEATRELVHDLEGLPLAIHVAGRLLQAEARLGWGVDQLLVELRQGVNLLKAQPPSDMIGVERDASPTVAALLKRSTDSLDEDMRTRFALLGIFVPKPATFDLDAMAAAWDVPDPRSFARQLVDRGLLEPIGGGRFQMHALLVLHARSLLETEFGNLP
jgi:DNA-binding SARP family transcriptional activator